MNSEAVEIYDNYKLTTNYVEINENDQIKINKVKKGEKDGLRILHYNIRGLNKHIDELISLVNEFYCRPDMIVCSETRNLETLSTLNIPGYMIYYNQGNITINDGLVVYVSETIEHIVNIIEIDSVKCIHVELHLENKDCAVTCIYRSPTNDVSKFLKKLKDYLTIDDHPEHILVGDINIDILKNEQHSQKYMNILYASGFLSGINIPTRVTSHSATCLDHIFVKSSQDITSFNPFVIESYITDHYPVMLNIQNVKKINTATEEENETSIRIDYKQLEKLTSNENWNIINRNPNECLNNIISKIQVIISKSTHYIKRKKNYKGRKPWTNSEIVRLIKQRDYSYKKYNRDRQNKEFSEKFKKTKNKLQNAIIRAKRQYYDTIYNTSKNSPKDLWNKVRSIVHKQKSCKRVKFGIIHENQIITDESKIATIFNNYYANVGPELSSKMNQDGNKDPCAYKSKNNGNQ